MRKEEEGVFFKVANRKKRAAPVRRECGGGGLRWRVVEKRKRWSEMPWRALIACMRWSGGSDATMHEEASERK